jgi:hypothetical protein
MTSFGCRLEKASVALAIRADRARRQSALREMHRGDESASRDALITEFKNANRRNKAA